MDGKFKRFMKRRTRSTASSDIVSAVQGSPYEGTLKISRQPIFLHQPLSKSVSEVRGDTSSLSTPQLRTLSYDQVLSGKTPTFLQTLPGKGNGPIKLQATHITDSGEVTTIIEDPRKTLRDLPNGLDYVVCKRSPSQDYDANTTPDMRRPSTTTTPRSVHSPALDDFPSPPGNIEWPRTSSSSSKRGERRGSSGSISHGLGLPSPVWSAHRQSVDSSSDCRSTGSRPSMSHTSSRSYGPINATLEALRKAEYSRLVGMYGHQGAARHIRQLDGQRMRARTYQSAQSAPKYSSIVLSPLPAPPAEQTERDPRHLSYQSVTSESCCDESSLCSSPPRHSFVSSCAESSATTAQTSFTEEDSLSTKEDIRSMVRQMRSHYLSALDQQPEEPIKSKSRKKSRKGRLMPSPVLDSTTTSHVESGHTSHHQDSDSGVSQQRRKVRSQPWGRLSPIEDSPSRTDGIDEGLKRADSGTLGALMADLTRSNIRKHAASRSQATQITISDANQSDLLRDITSDKNSWLDVESDSADEPHPASPRHSNGDAHPTTRPRIVSQHSTCNDMSLNTEPNESLDTVYNDLFAKDVHNVWSANSGDPHLESPGPTNEYMNHTPPRRILVIPESPEYTSLARHHPEGPNFI